MKIFNLKFGMDRYAEAVTDNDNIVIKILDTNYLEHLIKAGDSIIEDLPFEPSINATSKVMSKSGRSAPGTWRGIIIEMNDLTFDDFKKTRPEYFI